MQLEAVLDHRLLHLVERQVAELRGGTPPGLGLHCGDQLKHIGVEASRAKKRVSLATAVERQRE